jgi:hypothetical protein
MLVNCGRMAGGSLVFAAATTSLTQGPDAAPGMAKHAAPELPQKQRDASPEIVQPKALKQATATRQRF